jgi:ribosomal protein S18 acetylase RimI-like enzyme
MVQPVDTRARLTTWSELVGATTGLPKSAPSAVFGPLGLAADAPWRHVVGLLDGQPVATCSLFRTDQSLGVYWVGTVPAVRRRGVASALLEDARAHGERLAVLHSTEMARGLYARLGFQAHAPIEVYVWQPRRPR